MKGLLQPLDRSSTRILSKLWICSLGMCVYIMLDGCIISVIKVITGPLELEDLPKLDRMVSEFDAISEVGPERILRGNWEVYMDH